MALRRRAYLARAPTRGGRGDSLAVRQNSLGGLRGSSSFGGAISTQIGLARHAAPFIHPPGPARGPLRAEGDKGKEIDAQMSVFRKETRLPRALRTGIPRFLTAVDIGSMNVRFLWVTTR